jgi:hypothetical protein
MQNACRLPQSATDYGLIGVRPTQSNGTFTLVGTRRIPIWHGGRTEGDIEQSGRACFGLFLSSSQCAASEEVF